MRPLRFLALLLAACAAPPDPRPPSGASTAAPAIATAVDSVVLYGDDAAPQRPVAPVRVDGACPFECCTYRAWTMSATTTVYARPDAPDAVAFTVPAGTVLDADDGHVTISRLGPVVLPRPTVFHSGGAPVHRAAGDTLLVLDDLGEGVVHAWSAGRLLSVDGLSLGLLADAPPPGVVRPEAQWWAHVTTRDGRAGWLWMDRTPSVQGADACG